MLCLHVLFELKQYEILTAPLRPCDTTKLFIAVVKPYKPIASTTIAHWLWQVLEPAGIDGSIYSGHSVCGVSTSAATEAGATTNDNLKAVDWSSDFCFYYRPVDDS